MKIGIVGLSGVGKSTLFQLLTKTFGEVQKEYGKATFRLADVPDDRIDFLVDMYQPKKTSYATLEFVDVDGLQKGNVGGNQFLNDIREVDALIHVVRLFESGMAHIEGDLNALRDIETVNMELLFADLDIVEKRLDRILNATKKAKGVDIESEKSALYKYKEALEQEKLASSVTLNDKEMEAIKSLKFLTEKPQIIVLNTEDAGDDFSGKEEAYAYAEEKGLPMIHLSALMEAEIAQLPKEDQSVFMEDLGISESGIYKLARTVYDCMNLISFFTVGPDEVRAWTIERDTVARKAAGKIHSDIERGFIRAEIFNYNDLVTHGTQQKVKEAGLMRLEGKEYVMTDGDIVNFRFNV